MSSFPFFIKRGGSMSETQSNYNYKVVRQFAVMTVIWGIVGMLVGVIIAAQLVWPELNIGFLLLRAPASAAHQRGDFRLRRLRAVRDFLLRACSAPATRACSAPLARLHLLGLAAGHRAGGHHLAAGHDAGQGIRRTRVADRHPDRRWSGFPTRSCSSARSAKRKVSHIYVANWFYGGFILAVALLHIVNSAAIPVSLTKSYSAYAGAQDAMIQWWYGHNAVGFFLTAGFLGMMYYFVPKQAGARCIPTACRSCTSGR
jgi:cytochrome c oxidase cbb3-type subunit 1